MMWVTHFAQNEHMIATTYRNTHIEQNELHILVKMSYTFWSKWACGTLSEMIAESFAKVTFALDEQKHFMAHNLVLDAYLPWSY